MPGSLDASTRRTWHSGADLYADEKGGEIAYVIIF
jgi:hypothetical protein